MRRRKLVCGMCALSVGVAIIAMSGSAMEATDSFTKLPAAGAAVVLGEGVAYDEAAEAIETYVAGLTDSTPKTGVLEDVYADVAVIRAPEEKNEIVQETVKEEKIKETVELAQPVTADVAQSSEQVSTEAASETVLTITADTEEKLLAGIKIGNDVTAEATEVVELIPQEELDIPGADVAVKEKLPKEYENLVVAQVNDYVNVREEADTDSEVLGKLYDDSVGTLLEENDGWYKIQSGSVTGYVKAEYCVTGDEAIELVDEIGTRFATVNTATLKVRKEAGTDSAVLGLVPMGEELIVTEELEEWVKVTVEEGDGYVSKEFVDLKTEFVKAESKEEEAARLAAEAEARLRAQQAAQQTTRSKYFKTTEVPEITGDNEMGVEVAKYACQFVGNPYVYGGTSLTNGADCSGFVMSVYANFGVSLPHSSTADRTQGYAVDGLANAQPGDLVCYSGHVALYIGNNMIVHASSSKTGIIISNADYKTVLAVRRIF